MSWFGWGRDEARPDWKGDSSLRGHKKHTKAILTNTKIIRERFANYAYQVVMMAEAADQLSDCLSQFYSEARDKSSKRRMETFEDANRGMLDHATAHFDVKAFEEKILNDLDDVIDQLERVDKEIYTAEQSNYTVVEAKMKVDALLERKSQQEAAFREDKEFEEAVKLLARRQNYYDQIKKGVDTTVKYHIANRFRTMDETLVRLMELQFVFFNSGAGTFSDYRNEIPMYKKDSRRRLSFDRKNQSGGTASLGYEDANLDFSEIMKEEPVTIMPFTRVQNDHFGGLQALDEGYFAPRSPDTGALNPTGLMVDQKSVTSVPSRPETPVLQDIAKVYKIQVWTRPFGLTVNRRGEVTKVETHAEMMGIIPGDKVIAIDDHFINPKKFGDIARASKLPYELTLRREPEQKEARTPPRDRRASVAQSRTAPPKLPQATRRRNTVDAELMRRRERSRTPGATYRKETSVESLRELVRVPEEKDSYAASLEQANLYACRQLREKEDEILELRRKLASSQTSPRTDASVISTRKSFSPPKLRQAPSPGTPSSPVSPTAKDPTSGSIPPPPSFPPALGGQVPPPPPMGLPPPPGHLPGLPSHHHHMSPAEKREQQAKIIADELDLNPLEKVEPRKKMRRFHWEETPLESKAIRDTVWQDIGQMDSLENDFNFDRKQFEKLFQQRERSSRKNKKGDNDSDEGEGTKKRARAKKREKKVVIELIESRRSYNVDITLSRFKLAYSEMVDAVLKMDDSRLNLEGVQKLMSVFPSKEEIKLVSTYTGNPSMLGKVEQFFLTMASVPGLHMRLKNFRFLLEFSQVAPKIQNSLEAVIDACQALTTSEKLQFLLRLMLFCGLYLNAGTVKAFTFGFKLSSLNKFKSFKSLDRSTTLLHFIVSRINKHFSLGVSSSGDDGIDTRAVTNTGKTNANQGYLDDVREAVRKACRVEMGYLESEIKQTFQSLSLLKVCIREAATSDHPYPPKASEFCEYVDERYQTLNNLLSNCHRDFAEASQYYGEKECTWEEFFQVWEDFFREYNMAEKDVARAIANSRRQQRITEQEQQRRLIRRQKDRTRSARRAQVAEARSRAPKISSLMRDDKLASQMMNEAFDQL